MRLDAAFTISVLVLLLSLIVLPLYVCVFLCLTLGHSFNCVRDETCPPGTTEKSWHGALGTDFKREKPQHAVKLDVVSRYMFTMAMENDDLDDWVTEKVFLLQYPFWD